jgi:outer membrane protein OmpA-like peptidoglycan-associated protein
MRFVMNGAAAGAALLVFVGPVMAQSPAPPPPYPVMQSGIDWTGFYAGAELGGDSVKFPGHITAGTTPATPPLTLTPTPGSTVSLVNHRNGAFTGGGQIGYDLQLPSNWVIGGEVDLKGGGPSVTTLLGPTPPFPFVAGDSFKASTSWGGSVRAKLGYAWGPLLPYVTGGFAFADLTTTTNFIAIGGFPAATASRSTMMPGWTAGAGLEYALNPAWSIAAEYRYSDYGSTTGNLGSLATISNAARTAFAYAPISGKVGMQDNTFLVKLNYHFGAPPPPPPAPVMPAAAPVAAPVPARVFLVFFDWDRDNITPQGMRVVEQAANAYRSGAPVRLMVTGYTDRSGSPGYNQRLSERRANNVARALQGMGVPREQMAVSGKGENDNRVPTAPGVREPQNRRVEIVFR